MKRLLPLALLLSMMAGSAFAADSRTNRADETIGFTITPVGLHVATLLSSPVGIQFIANENWMFGIEAGGSTGSFSDGETDADAKYVNTGANIRWFPGTNSFNFGLAFNQRTFELEGTTTATDGAATETAVFDMTATASVTSLTIGNRWSADFGLTFAIDWLILSSASSTSVDTNVSANVDGVPLNAAQTADAIQELEDFGEYVNQLSAAPGILVFTIGWAF